MLTTQIILVTGGTGSFGHTFVPMTLAVWLLDGSGAESFWSGLRRAAGAG